MIPNLLSEVEACKREHPEAWAHAHTGSPQSDDFIKLLAARCHAIDSRFGNNGKRGNPLDLSDDALCFKGEGADFDPTANNAPRTVVDVIVAAGSPSAAPSWVIVTNPSAPVAAAWVQPGAEPVPEPEPIPAPSFPYPDEQTIVRAFQERVRLSYKAVNRPFPDPNDPDAFRHFARYGYSCHEMPEPQAAKKHIAELRADLGAPPE